MKLVDFKQGKKKDCDYRNHGANRALATLLWQAARSLSGISNGPYAFHYVCEKVAELKADNDGVPCRTLIGCSGLRFGIAENGVGTKTVRIFPGTNRSGGECRFRAFCNVDYSAGFSNLAVA